MYCINSRYSGNIIAMTIFVTLISFGAMSCSTTSVEQRNKADEAVANILFDYEYSEEYTSYLVKDDGFVDVTFAKNIPTQLYDEIVNKLNNHPDINGVLAGTTGAYCKRF